MTQDRVLISGASGFVGRELARQLQAEGCHVIGTTRLPIDQARLQAPAVAEWRSADFEFPDRVAWAELVRGCHSVVHLAAKVHVLQSATPREVTLYRTVNHTSSIRLAAAAAQAKLARFVFLSSVKASNADGPAEVDPYGASKRDAEQSLRELGASQRLPVVILRSPLIYGPGVKANFARLLWLARWRFPLPIAAVRNARSLIYVENLAHAIRLCRTHPMASGQIFPVCDVTLSTPELLAALSSAFGVKARVFPLPVGLLRKIAHLSGRSADFERLFGSLVVDPEAIQSQLGWQPPVPFAAGLQTTVSAYLSRR